MSEHRVTLTKLESDHNNLRTSVIEGTCQAMPRVNESFRMLAEALEISAGVRIIVTSRVKKVTKKEGSYIFETQNSRYMLAV